MQLTAKHFRLLMGVLVAGGLALTLALSAVPALALLVQPVLIKLSTSGSNATAGIEVVNDRATPITVEVTVESMELPERGAPVRAANDGDEFQIFPLQAVIPAGGRQVFRVRWLGDQALSQGKLYMFSTAELPVAQTEGQTGLSLYYAVESVVAVSPTGARPELSVDKVERWTNSEGVKGLAVTFHNEGPAIGFVTEGQMRLTIPGSDWSRTITPGEMNAAFGLGVIPANAKRVLFMAKEDVPADGEIIARFEPQSGL